MKPKQHGGKRPGAGRPLKYGKEKAELYRRSMPKSWFKWMDEQLAKIKAAEKAFENINNKK